MCRAEQIIEISFLRECGLGCVLGFSCCARKAQASPFDIKTALAGRTLTPMPPAGGGLTVELWHKSETHIGAAVCSAAWGALCRCVRFYGPTVHPRAGLYHTNAASAHHAAQKSEGWHQASPRLANRTREMIHDSVTQPSITRKIPSASVACTRYHGRNAVNISTKYTSGMDSLSFIAIRISKSSK